MSEEAAAGNYVIAGGGWNHALCGSLEMYESQQQVPPWVSTLDESELPSGFSDNVTATAENINAGFTYSDNNPVKLTFTLAAQ